MDKKQIEKKANEKKRMEKKQMKKKRMKKKQMKITYEKKQVTHFTVTINITSYIITKI